MRRQNSTEISAFSWVGRLGRVEWETLTSKLRKGTEEEKRMETPPPNGMNPAQVWSVTPVEQVERASCGRLVSEKRTSGMQK